MLQQIRAAALSDALALIAREPGRRVLAGATDIYPAEVARLAWFGAAAPPALDISRLSGLRGVTRRDGGVSIGALTTWTDLIEADLPAAFDGLRQAARQVGGVQIQNRGTIGGNLCNASPAADGVPPLLALGAAVELASAAGSRQLPLSEFILGNRKTALRPGELMTAVLVPPPAPGERSVFLKLGARSYLVISIASVAANASLDADGRIAAVRIAVGACSAAPVRLLALEARLAGERPDSVRIADSDLLQLAPIDDVRASAAYRLASARVLVERAIRGLAAADEGAA